MRDGAGWLAAGPGIPGGGGSPLAPRAGAGRDLAGVIPDGGHGRLQVARSGAWCAVGALGGQPAAAREAAGSPACCACGSCGGVMSSRPRSAGSGMRDSVWLGPHWQNRYGESLPVPGRSGSRLRSAGELGKRPPASRMRSRRPRAAECGWPGPGRRARQGSPPHGRLDPPCPCPRGVLRLSGSGPWLRRSAGRRPGPAGLERQPATAS
jgi:hypothetical protein